MESVPHDDLTYVHIAMCDDARAIHPIYISNTGIISHTYFCVVHVNIQVTSLYAIFNYII